MPYNTLTNKELFDIEVDNISLELRNNIYYYINELESDFNTDIVNYIDNKAGSLSYSKQVVMIYELLYELAKKRVTNIKNKQNVQNQISEEK
jgi:hypothetical protein